MTVTGTAGCFTLSQPEREAALLPSLAGLTRHHRQRCLPYARILDALGEPSGRTYESVAELPWLPVRLFKHHTLKSVPDNEVFRVLTSSGTTGDVSRIYLDAPAAAAQQRALAGTLATILGPRRLPMLIVDSRAVISRNGPLHARGAGVLGMMTYGRDHTFLLDEAGQPDQDAAERFLAAHGGQPFLIFGFTYLVWVALRAAAEKAPLDLSNGVLIHTGGWKKLADQAVTNTEFRQGLADITGLRRVHNFYGMAEQIGTIFLEGARVPGLYCPDFADVIVRDPATWEPAPMGTPGVLEVVSELPRSYPGHVLLTEDLGVIHGVDDGDWPGKRFSVLGRLPRAEPRGCSDAVPAEPCQPTSGLGPAR